MRGEDRFQGAMFSYVSLEDRVPREHPLRAIWALSKAALPKLSGRLGRHYARVGRPSIPPQKLLRALLLQVLCSVLPTDPAEIAVQQAGDALEGEGLASPDGVPQGCSVDCTRWTPACAPVSELRGSV